MRVHPISGGMPALKAGMFPHGGFMAAREAAMPHPACFALAARTQRTALA